MFNSSNCKICENIDCLTRCQWIDIELNTAKEEINKMINMEKSFVLKECITCFACEEYCPYNSHPFDLIVKLQEKYNSLEINPRILENVINKYKPSEELKLKEIDPEKPVLNKCDYSKTHAKKIEGKLFENLQYVEGIDYYCNLVYRHYARDSVSIKRAQIILENINKQGIKEMICFHEGCYQLYTNYYPKNNLEVSFRPIHLLEYIYNYLKDHESEIEKLNMKIAYQRPCTSRFVPEADEWVDKVCDLIGVERVARKYDRETALCCTGPFAMIGRKELVRPTINKNINDMIAHGAEACVFNCPICQLILGSKIERKGLKNFLLSDLCRLAIGEDLG
ncbi:MAG: heterodisulfide reductase-related iron-sulfur binding cluster [Promethearchaeota archaeon]